MSFKLTNVRLSFPDLFTARLRKNAKQGDVPRFGAVFLIDKADPQIKKIEAEILAVAEAKWPGKGASVVKSIKNDKNKYNFRDGDIQEYDGYAGMMSLKASSKTRPLVIDRAREPIGESDGKIYAGCYVNATVEFFGYDIEGKGISATLRGVQFVKDGDAFGGSAPATPDDFEDLGMDDLDSLVG